MSGDKNVLVTDYAWPSLDRERAIFAKVGASVVVATTGSEEELVRLAPSARGILCNWKPVSRRVLEAAADCIAVGRYGIGLDNIDVEAATRLGIVVTNVPAYCVDDVADHAIALLLACNRKVGWFDRDIKAGRYDLKAQEPLRRLRGHVLGLAGYGRIGQAVSQRARSFGLHVIALRPRRGVESAPNDGAEFVSLNELLERSDYLSLHLPATPETKGMFDAAAFGGMKPGAVLINTARGSLIRTPDLLDALETGRIAAAGIDVWEVEPLPAGDRLAAHPRVVATPHAAFYSDESVAELQETAAAQMTALLSAQIPRNIVNPAVLDSPQLRLRLQMGDTAKNEVRS
jgi:D-3-phosphoglycerate dehydrogenase / 2-oxoglutarate reductase